MDVLKSDENKTLDEEEIDEMTPLKTELTDEGEESKYRISILILTVMKIISRCDIGVLRFLLIDC